MQGMPQLQELLFSCIDGSGTVEYSFPAVCCTWKPAFQTARCTGKQQAVQSSTHSLQYVAPGNQHSQQHLAQGNQQAVQWSTHSLQYVAPGNQHPQKRVAQGNQQAVQSSTHAPQYVPPGNRHSHSTLHRETSKLCSPALSHCIMLHLETNLPNSTLHRAASQLRCGATISCTNTTCCTGEPAYYSVEQPPNFSFLAVRCNDEAGTAAAKQSSSTVKQLPAFPTAMAQQQPIHSCEDF